MFFFLFIDLLTSCHDSGYNAGYFINDVITSLP